MNTKFLRQSLDEISIEFIKEVIEFSYSAGHKHHAPLGCSGDDLLLYGQSRRKEISLRLHSGYVKLLVTDNCGSFLFYGGFDTSLLPVSFIANQYYEIIQHVSYLLDNTSRKSTVTELDKEKMFKQARIMEPLLSGFIV